MTLGKEELLSLFTCVLINFMIRGFELVSCGFELVTRGFELALLNLNLWF